MAKKLGGLQYPDQYWVDLLPSYLLTMKDLRSITGSIYLIQPQDYIKLETVDDLLAEDSDYLTYFYADRFNPELAVTGSGADTWIIYRPGLLAAMKELYNRLKKTNLPKKTK